MEKKYAERVKQIIEAVDPLCKIMSCTAISDVSYTVEIKTKFLNDYENDCKNWVNKYSLETHSTWIVCNTYPHLTRLEFRKDFVCQHAKKNKAKYSSRLGKGSFNCRASMKVTTRKSTYHTKKKDPLLKAGFNTTIKLASHHNHAVHVPEIKISSRLSDETETANTHHKACLITSTEEEGGAAKILVDRRDSPLDHHASRSENISNPTSDNMIDIIECKQQIFIDNDVSITVKENPFIKCVLTPLMMRAHQEPFSSEIVFVDTIGSYDQTGSIITFLFGATKIGAIPLGCVIQETENEKCYTEAFITLKEAIGPTGFGGKFPSVIMTNDNNAKCKALATAFTESKILLSSVNVCEEMWAWLSDFKHGIEKSHRKLLMSMFRQIVYEKDVNTCEGLIKEYMRHNLVLTYPIIRERFTGLCKRKKDWCICYRSSNNTNSMIELSLRIFRENVLQCSKAFNSVGIIDFVTNQLQQYYIKRLRKYALGRVTKLELLHGQFCIQSEELKVEKLDDYTYHVTSSDDIFPNVVHTDIEMCDCQAGQKGAFCKHLCAVELKEEIYTKNPPTLDFNDRISLVKLAEGKDIDESFFKDMVQSNLCNTSSSEVPSAVFISEEKSQTIPQFIEPPPEDEDCKEEVTKMGDNMNAILNMVKENKNEHMREMLLVFNRKLSELTTPSAFFDFCSSLITQKRPGGKQIKMGPTLISKRKRQGDLVDGSNRTQSECPLDEESIRKRPKRTRNLAKSINQNQPNAKRNRSTY